MRWWLVTLGLALLLGFVGRWTGLDAFYFLSGALYIATLVLVVAPLVKIPKMRGLFPPLNGRRWCAQCGNPAEKGQPCATCGHSPKKNPRKT